jgi:hypothetical protein
VALLAPKAFDLCHGNALNTHFCQGGAHIVKLERFDDGDDHFHGSEAPVQVGTQFNVELETKLLRRSMTYSNGLMYNAQQRLASGACYIKNGAGSF